MKRLGMYIGLLVLVIGLAGAVLTWQKGQGRPAANTLATQPSQTDVVSDSESVSEASSENSVSIKVANKPKKETLDRKSVV